MLTVFFFSLLYLFWSFRWTEWKTFFFFFFFLSLFTKQQLDGFTSPRGRNNPEKGGKKKKKMASRRVKKKDFSFLYFFFLRRRRRLHLWWKGWEVFWRAQQRQRRRLPFFYIQISSVVVVGGKNKNKKIEEEKGGKQRSLSGMNDPRFIFSKLIYRITTLIAPTSINSNRVARQKAQKKRLRRKFRNLHLDIRFHQTNVFAWSAVRVVPTPVKRPTAFSLKNK